MNVMSANIWFPKNSRRDEIFVARVSSVVTESSWENLTDTAEIVIPRKTYFSDNSLHETLKRGDAVIIALGYNGELVKEFEGVIAKVVTDVPVRILCEDYMYALKQIRVNKSWKFATLKDIIADILPDDYNTDIADITLGAVKIEQSTVAGTLEYLQSEFSIYSYFKGKTLVSGKIYTDNTEVVNYDFEKNIVSHDLIYKYADDLRIKVTAESFNADGKTTKVSVGDDDGVESKLIYRNVKSESELKKRAQDDLERMKTDGYEGTLVTFGQPFVAHGYTANLTSRDYPERNGKYYVDAVTTEFDSSPAFRRTVTIGKKASA